MFFAHAAGSDPGNTVPLRDCIYLPLGGFGPFGRARGHKGQQRVIDSHATSPSVSSGQTPPALSGLEVFAKNVLLGALLLPVVRGVGAPWSQHLVEKRSGGGVYAHEV